MTATADPPGWRLHWSDDFNTLDLERWNLVHSFEPTNNSLQAYLPEQVRVENGNLVILAEEKSAGGLSYSSGQIVSKESQRYGRWEVRAKLPTSNGMWPAIWLLPDVDKHQWPSGGEIDIMENRGNHPTLTSSAFHYGASNPYLHRFVYDEQQTLLNGELVNYHNGFHTYAVDWTPRCLRFYVDGVHFYTVHDREVGGFLSSNVAPMQLVINNAIGGDFLPAPDSSTQWPQSMEIDWVRAYRPDPESFRAELNNPGFEEGGGSLAGWSVFGERLADSPNVHATSDVVLEGSSALKLQGAFGGGTSFSGVSQGVTVASGDLVTAELSTFVRKEESVAGTKNLAILKIEFYSEFGGEFDGPSMLDYRELYFVNGWTPEEEWIEHTLQATAPDDAVEARLAIVFQQLDQSPGAVYVDNVRVTAETQTASETDSDGRTLRTASDGGPSTLAGKASGNPGASTQNTYENIAIAAASLACLYGLFRLLVRFIGRRNSSTTSHK